MMIITTKITIAVTINLCCWAWRNMDVTSRELLSKSLSASRNCNR